MPVRHELSRTAAALVTALALVVLPITGTIAPANASVIPSAPGSPTADSDPDGLVDGTDAASAGDSGGSDDSGSGAADGSDAGSEAGTDSADSEAKADDDPDNDEDNACDVPSDGADNSKPCAVEDSLGSTWNAVEKTIRISASEDMPESWIGKEFAGPEKKEDVKRWPVQNSSESADSSTATDAEAEGSTDDSGNPVPESADEAPDMYSFDENGYVVDADNPGAPMKFTEFEEAPSPEWTFTSDGRNITVEEGEEYPPTPGDEADADKDGSSASDGLEANQDGTVDGTDSASADDDGTNSSDPNSDASSSSDSTDADSSAGESSDSDSTSDSENTASSDSNSSDSAKSDSKDADKSDSADADSDKQTSDSDSSSTSDGSDSGSSDKDGKDSKDSADKDGSGSTSADGGPIGNDNTPDPSTGNGSSDTRDEIPGDVGNDWMMPGNDDSPPPDYSDPVPQNPDTPVPDDDTDLITGGNTPEPRSDKPPATSFGESIVSTIASSWPIFILAASGMAAVGFIIYLVGRRNKQD